MTSRDTQHGKQTGEREGNGIPRERRTVVCGDAGEIRRTVLHRGAKFEFEQVEYTGSDGRPLTREFVRHPGAVVILPLLAGAAGEPVRIVLIQNYRHSVNQHLWELPAGTREAEESPQATAGRELTEETGYVAGSMELLGSFYTSPGLSDELMWAYVAGALAPAVQRLEADERITVHPTPVAEVLAMIDRGELMDAKSMMVILWAIRKGLMAFPK